MDEMPELSLFMDWGDLYSFSCSINLKQLFAKVRDFITSIHFIMFLLHDRHCANGHGCNYYA